MLPPFGFGARDALRAVAAVVRGAPTMLGALAEQGPEALDVLVEEVAAAVRDWEDDEGLGFPQVAHVLTARR